mmetsp:Transcript_3774/g.10146  ORF Transcript_3774/g.10146 Transcript_3774/m.10146 type:complete len:274 (+) Transcript_3774:741-1562(+)
MIVGTAGRDGRGRPRRIAEHERAKHIERRVVQKGIDVVGVGRSGVAGLRGGGDYAREESAGGARIEHARLKERPLPLPPFASIQQAVIVPVAPPAVGVILLLRYHGRAGFAKGPPPRPELLDDARRLRTLVPYDLHHFVRVINVIHRTVRSYAEAGHSQRRKVSEFFTDEVVVLVLFVELKLGQAGVTRYHAPHEGEGGNLAEVRTGTGRRGGRRRRRFGTGFVRGGAERTEKDRRTTDRKTDPRREGRSGLGRRRGGARYHVFGYTLRCGIE